MSWMACTCPVFRWIFLPNRLGWLRRCHSIYDREESEARSTLEVSDPWCSSLEVKVFLLASQIKLLRDHPYITSAKGLGGWVKKNCSFCWRSVLYLCWHGDGNYRGSSYVQIQKCADVVYGWSLSPAKPALCHKYAALWAAPDCGAFFGPVNNGLASWLVSHVVFRHLFGLK